MSILDNNLVGAYLHGSVAFPGFQPESGDIDFYVVVNRPLSKADVDGLDHLHSSLAREHDLGGKLDGFYIPLAKARKDRSPKGLVYGANGRVRLGGYDDAWAIHREHFQHSSYISLHGPRARKIFPAPSWPELRNELYHQLHSVRKNISNHPACSVLSLSRLIYNFEKGNITVSKIQAAQRAVKNLPPKWWPLLRSATRDYRGRADNKDRALLKREARAFLGFASLQMIAFDPTENPRSPAVKYLTKTHGKTLKER